MHDTPSAHKKLRPWHAAPAMWRLLRDPDDTRHVFTIIEALSFRELERTRDRMRASADGRRILRERPDLLASLRDRDALAAMPEGSLGRAYLEFLRAEGITADGLVAASIEGSTDVAPMNADELELLYVGDRLRDAHDLWHVVTGYHGDLLGEASLLAFSFAQTGTPGVGFIAAIGWLKAAAIDARDLIAGGYHRGRTAAWLPDQHWETMLARPLSEVRARLRIAPPPPYEPLRTRDIAPGSLARWERTERPLAA
ncbi:Coq4 family protein [Sandaracinus amylolyticus]|nr:Coq4 family protein [Sandaracinus amylolyticus]